MSMIYNLISLKSFKSLGFFLKLSEVNGLVLALKCIIIKTNNLEIAQLFSFTAALWNRYDLLRFRIRLWKPHHNKKMVVQNLAFSQLEAAFSPEVVISFFNFRLFRLLYSILCWINIQIRIRNTFWSRFAKAKNCRSCGSGSTTMQIVKYCKVLAKSRQNLFYDLLHTVL